MALLNQSPVPNRQSHPTSILPALIYTTMYLTKPENLRTEPLSPFGSRECVAFWVPWDWNTWDLVSWCWALIAMLFIVLFALKLAGMAHSHWRKITSVDFSIEQEK